MRVALVAPDIADYSLEVARTLATRADVLLCMPEKHVPPSNANSPRLEVLALPWPRQSSVLASIRFAFRLARSIRRWRPDVVHFLDANNLWMPLLVALIGRRQPVVTTVHDVVVHPGDVSSARVPGFAKAFMVRRSTAIVVHGASSKDRAAATLPVRSAQILIAPHPPLLAYAGVSDGAPRQDASFTVLFFGRIYDYKGLRYLLEAAEIVADKAPQIRFVIAGAGDDLTKYAALLARLPSVRLLNRFIPRDEASRLFAEASLVALPYTEASQSGVLMMAMALGLPVVATDVGDMAETVRETGAGLLVPPADSAALARAIIELATDDPARERMRQASFRALVTDYSRAAISDTMIANYERAAAAFAVANQEVNRAR